LACCSSGRHIKCVVTASTLSYSKLLITLPQSSNVVQAPLIDNLSTCNGFDTYHQHLGSRQQACACHLV